MTQFNSPTNQSPPINPGWAPVDSAQQMQDREHLKILAIIHYIYAGLTALAGCGGIIYIVLGLIMASNPDAFRNGPNDPPPPQALGSIFAIMGGVVMVVAWTFAALLAYAGRCLHRQRHRVFCMIISGFNCLSIPLGTVLGIFTLVVLARPSVAAMFLQRKLSA